MPAEQSDMTNKQYRVEIRNRNFHFSLVQAVAFIAVFALVGGYIIWHSFATSSVIATVQAEKMTLSAGASVITDSSASGGQAIRLTANGAVTGLVSLPSQATTVTVTAHSNTCKGGSSLGLAIDGTTRLPATTVSTTKWTNYSATINIASGSHSLKLIGSNLGTINGCTHKLYVDVTMFYGLPPTPTPTVAFSASPTSVASGSPSTLTWSSTNATGCTASGAWSGSKPTNDSASTGALNTSATYNLSCTGTGGSASASATVTVTSSTSTGSIPYDGQVALALGKPSTPFAAGSFWNTLLPSNAPLNVNSTAYVNSIVAFLQQNTNATYGALNIYHWSAPVYVVPGNQPSVAVNLYCAGSTVSKPNFVNNVLAGGVPVPTDAHGSADTDAEIQIYQPSSDKLWEFWQFQKDPSGAWGACYGGRIDQVSQSNGVFPYPYSATATGLPNLGGIPRIEELKAGHIDHAINLSLPVSLLLSPSIVPANTPGALNGISSPANRSDGANTNVLAIPEGLRFRLPANLDLSQYNLTPVARMIAVAAQKYGFVVVDRSGTVSIRLGDPSTYTTAGYPDPYVQILGAYYGKSNNAIMQNFPWDKLQALQFNY